MERFLLDTTVLIDLSKNYGVVEQALDELVIAGGVLGVCAVSVAEFLVGIPTPWREKWEIWISDYAYWDISVQAAARAGAIRYDLVREGAKILVADALLAATALEIDATLITNDVKDFPVKGLRLLRLGP